MARNTVQRCTRSESCSKADRHTGRCDHKRLLDQVAPAQVVNQAGEYEPAALCPCDYSRHGLMLSDVRQIDPPILVRGAQGIWEYAGAI